MITRINKLTTTSFTLSKIRLFSSNNGNKGSLKERYDVVVVGGGIVGTATARELLERNPKLKVCVVEKEDQVAQHQSSHNSGVIHCGIYYKPGSNRARLCVKGADMMFDYCQRNNIPHERCGKLIVATKENELGRLQSLFERGQENGVKGLRMIEKDEIKSIEPHITGLRAIHSPNTGIVDFGKVTQSFAKDIISKGGDIIFKYQADEFKYFNNDELDQYIRITSTKGKIINTNYLITCAGMYSDKVSIKAYGDIEPSIVPFRGSFLKLKDEYKHLIKGMVYPVPNSAFPFLGVHFTKKINGDVWLGPNAVVALDREGYSYKDVNAGDVLESMMNRGLLKMAMYHFWYGVGELIKDIFPNRFLKHCLPFMPSLTIDQVKRGDSGVRAMAIDADKGELIEDFIFDSPLNKPILHVRNAPSPSATSSLSIAQEIVDMAESVLFNKSIDNNDINQK